MEKFFRLKEDNPICNGYFKWLENTKTYTDCWGKFKKLTGIEAIEFAPYSELYIVPTENDLENFGNQFVKESFNDGLRKFKKNSKIHKTWQDFIAGGHIKLIPKPSTIFDFMLGGGRWSSSLFDYEGKLYTKITSDWGFPENFIVPQGYEEIKASEYYTIIEQIKGE